MKLARKTFLTIAASLGILFAVQVYIARDILMQGFEKLENHDARANVERFRDALQEQVDALANKMVDWAMWDDAYRYVNNPNKEFEKSNLEDNALTTMKVQLLVFLDAKNHIVFGKMADMHGNITAIPPAVRSHLQQHPSLYAFKDMDHHINGLVIMDGRPMLISSLPVIQSDGSGPIGGAIIVGRSLDQSALTKLSQLIHLPIQISPVNQPLPADIANIASSLGVPEDITITVTSANLLTGYVYFNDIYGDKCVYAAVQIPRDVHKQAEATLFSFLFTMLVGGLLLTFITHWLMSRSVVLPIIRLNEKIHAIGLSADLGTRVVVAGQDEIASLAGEINQMLGHIEESKASMQRLLDNITQGYFLFGPDGIIADGFSRSTLDIFGINPAGKHVAELLDEDPGVWESYSASLFAEALPFAELIVLCPNLLQRNDRFIELAYIDIRDQAQRISHIMVMATDVTALRLLAKQKDEENSKNRMIIKILAAKNDFLEALSMLYGLTDSQNLLEFPRKLHTLKGCFNALSCASFAENCHLWEDRFAKSPTIETAQAAQSALTEQINAFIDAHDSLLKIRENTGTTRVITSKTIHEAITEAVRHDTAPAIIDKLRSMAEVPAREALSWLDYAFMTSATKTGKEALPAVWLPSTTIDPDPYMGLLRSLIHIPRNAADHGLEDPEEREALGKPRAGRLTVQLALQHDTYSLVITDDGAGIDIAKIAAKAMQQGLPAPRTRDEAFELLFNDGFSTKETVTALSGRGVGLSSVRSEARKLGGDVLVDSDAGKGTRITVRFKRQELLTAEKVQQGAAIACAG